jgi:hypothetical protein
MHEFVSDKESSALPSSELYNKVADFEQFQYLMPEQVINWSAEGDLCSFTIRGMADLQIRYAEKIPESFIRIVSVKSPFPFEIAVTIDNDGVKGESVCQTRIRAEMNPMLSMLASRPLKHLAAAINATLARGV